MLSIGTLYKSHASCSAHKPNLRIAAGFCRTIPTPGPAFPSNRSPSRIGCRVAGLLPSFPPVADFGIPRGSFDFPDIPDS